MNLLLSAKILEAAGSASLSPEVLLSVDALDLSDTHLRTLDGMRYLQNCEQLDVSHTVIESLRELAALQGLKRLTARDLSWRRDWGIPYGARQQAPIEFLTYDATFAVFLPKLEELDLSGTSIRQEMSLANLSAVKRLQLARSLVVLEMEFLERLAWLPNLEELDLAGIECTDLNPLLGSSSLRSVTVGYCGDDISAVPGVSSLREKGVLVRVPEC